MPVRLALAVFVVVAASALHLFASLVSVANADVLDGWCVHAKLPSSIAICSDPQLRALTIERQHAFDEARARVGEARAPALLANQNAWVKSYPGACGLVPDVAPSLPLAPAIRECMARAGQARIAYLKTYGASDGAGAVTSTVPVGGRIGPGFDCAVAPAPLTLLICADAELSKTDLGFNQAYQALRQSLDPAGRQRLAAEDVEFLNTVKLACGVPEAGAVAGSGECVAAHFNQKRSEWMSRLSGPALEEVNRPIEQHVALQARLQQINFLPADKIDGVYGPATRTAISEWQIATGRPVTSFISNADAAVFGVGEPPPIAGLEPNAPRVPAPQLEGPAPSAPVARDNGIPLNQRGGVYRIPVPDLAAAETIELVRGSISDILGKSPE